MNCSLSYHTFCESELPVTVTLTEPQSQSLRVADRLYGVYKVHGNYGRVFSEWSAIEKEMGDGLQSAGHHMDVYAASIDDILEEEEHYADQLKEYLFYAEALRCMGIVRHTITSHFPALVNVRTSVPYDDVTERLMIDSLQGNADSIEQGLCGIMN
ncbi:sorting nexihypothetical protein [Limosa lapponica baueri]|uniref:Uncharacterized protein n=1 Tax=Limosa lapponica baueri TaxID=1758121 RepID=A0A2I0TRZ3_LIMLA|nr:sorting nexihypothetical protein [Limosa lapponica baueri]